MTKLICVPMRLYPVQRLNFSRCSIVPGVSVARATGPLRTAIDAFAANLPVKPDVFTTHFVCVDEDGYLNALKKRLLTENTSLPEGTYIDAEAIAKQAVLSMILAGRVSFAFRGTHVMEADRKHGRMSYQGNRAMMGDVVYLGGSDSRRASTIVAGERSRCEWSPSHGQFDVGAIAGSLC